MNLSSTAAGREAGHSAPCTWDLTASGHVENPCPRAAELPFHTYHDPAQPPRLSWWGKSLLLAGKNRQKLSLGPHPGGWCVRWAPGSSVHFSHIILPFTES